MQYAIFDMDGTLIDSMPAWSRLGGDYLRSKGVTPPDDLRDKVASMTMLECGEYASGLGVPGSPQVIAGELTAWMERQYRETIPEREGVQDYLRLCRDAGVKMCVATATDRILAEACLERLGASPAEIVVYEDVLYPAETAKKAGFPTVGVYDPASGEENARALRRFCDAFIPDWKACTEIVI